MAKKRGQNEGSIRKRPDGTWEARVTIGIMADGKQKQKSLYGKTRQEVSAKMTDLLMSAPVIKCKKTPRKKCNYVAERREKR